MNRFSAVFLTIVITLIAGAAVAMNQEADKVAVSMAWARATPGMGKIGGAYLTITNRGPADRLVSVSSQVADKAKIHNSTQENGMVKMRQAPGVDIPAGKTVTLQPGGYHVMFMGLHAPLKEGGSFPLTLHFEKAGAVTTTVNIEKVGAMGHGSKPMDHGGMPMGH